MLKISNFRTWNRLLVSGVCFICITGESQAKKWYTYPPDAKPPPIKPLDIDLSMNIPPQPEAIIWKTQAPKSFPKDKDIQAYGYSSSSGFFPEKRVPIGITVTLEFFKSYRGALFYEVSQKKGPKVESFWLKGEAIKATAFVNPKTGPKTIW